ncbi:DUF4118 domain-containing protein [Streptomyces gibsoniae]|uniref:histidine kinase n=2 Tax=Streptomyces gibsoniae TaxID=3075529 RepID=A0ABU2U5W7_9ACTN|nr:DUF4118 domain-containing protein [Streptomyces sp. DSM 41699]
MARGRLQINLGAAPGVGKTYAMLQEGLRLQSLGADAAAGLIESHGRRPVSVMAEEVEMIPRHTLVHRGAPFEEMDLDAVLTRHPQVALVDELAHTNVPGSRNAKRWQDVEELLDAGIDVITTLNIQHLESLADVVRQITGVPQHETLPDEVARRADQIELVDLPPEVLRRRMVHGDIYPPDRIEAALTHYFRVGNLTALRELALLWLADRVEEGLQRYRAKHGIVTPWETRERILVGLTGGPEGPTLIRRAARITARTPGSELLALHVARGDGLTPAHPAALHAQRTLVESLGGSYHQTTGEDIPEALLQFAEAENITQIVLGASRRNRLSLLLRAGVGQRTIRRSGPIDVHIVHHGRAAGHPVPHRARGIRAPCNWVALAGALLLPLALTLVLVALRDHLGLSSDLVLYLLAVVVIALAGGILPALAAAVVAGLLADYFFTTPVHSLAIGRAGDILALAVFLIVAAAVGSAAGNTARRTRQTAYVAAEARALTRLATAVMRGQDLPALLEHIRENFGLASVSLLERDRRVPGSPWYVVASTGRHPPEKPDQADTEVPADDDLTLAVRGRRLSSDDQRTLAACATQLAIAHARRSTGALTGEDDPRAAAERTRASLLLAASRDLRTPLHSAATALTRLQHAEADQSQLTRDQLLETARSSVRRAAQLVKDLDDLSRLHGGAIDFYLRPVDLNEVLTASLDDLGPGGHTLDLSLPEDLPDVIADASLLSRVLASLAADALRHSPPHQPPALTAETLPGRLQIRITDANQEPRPYTPGTEPTTAPPSAREDNLALRLSRDLTEAMDGTLEAAFTGPSSFSVTVALPTSARSIASRTPHDRTPPPGALPERPRR